MRNASKQGENLKNQSACSLTRVYPSGIRQMLPCPDTAETWRKEGGKAQLRCISGSPSDVWKTVYCLPGGSGPPTALPPHWEGSVSCQEGLKRSSVLCWLGWALLLVSNPSPAPSSPPVFLCQADCSMPIPSLCSPILLPAFPTHPSFTPAPHTSFPQAGTQDPEMVLPTRQQIAPGKHL